MKDENKTKAQLIDELRQVRSKLASFSNFTAPDSDNQAVADTLPLTLYEFDLNGRFTYLNAKAMHSFGYTQQDLEQGLYVDMVLHPEDLERAHQNIKRTLEKGEGSDGVEYVSVHRDGTHQPIKIYSLPIYKEGTPIGIRGTAVDIADIRASEEALRQSETYYRSLFNSTGTAMIIFGDDSVIRICNANFERISGYSRDEIEGRMKWSDFVQPDELERMRVYHTKRTRDEKDVPLDYEFAFIGRDKKKQLLHVFIQYVPETGERVCSLIDVTDTRRAEEALRRSDQRYELVVRGANDGIWDWDLESDSVYYSPRYKAILGYEDHELPNVADSWRDRVHPEDLEYVFAANLECIEGKTDQFEVEYRMRHKEGSWRWILGRGASVKNEQGIVYRMAGTHTDITDRKSLERTTNTRYAISEAVAASEDLEDLYLIIHTIIDKAIGASNFFIALMDEDRDTIIFPFFRDQFDSYSEIRGVSAPSAKGLTFQVIQTGTPLFLTSGNPVDRAKFDEFGVVGTIPEVWLGVPLMVQNKVIGAMVVQDYEDPLQYHDSDVALMEAASEQVALAIERKRNEETLTRMNEELEDEVERRTAELKEKASQLEAANRRLTELDEIKSSLVSSISHELRTPLTSIRGFAKLTGRDFFRHFLELADTPLLNRKGDRIRKNLEIIESEGERLTRLINDFLDINRIESGKATWNDTFINPCEVIHRAVQALSGAFAAKAEVSLIADLPTQVPPVHADPDKIQQVLVNLLGNACKFTLEGAVTVSLIENPDTVTVTVSDTGLGIPSDEMTHIFEKFHKSRAGDTISIKDKGTGLGLAICREIVEHYGGSIWVDSTPGQGSSFSFTLPSVPGTTTSC